MTRTVNLIAYLPEFLKEYREFEAIMTAENPEFQFIIGDTKSNTDNMFVATADDEGLKRYEDMLHIQALDDDTIEDRRTRIMTKFTNLQPYTFKTMYDRLIQLAGEDNIHIELIPNEYQLNVGLGLARERAFDIVEEIVQEMIPANLEYNVYILFNSHEILSQYTHEFLSEYSHEELRKHIFE